MTTAPLLIPVPNQAGTVPAAPGSGPSSRVHVPAGVAGLPGVPGLPGLPTRGRLPGRLPRDLLAPGVHLLAGAEPGRWLPWAEHVRHWGRVPARSAEDLVALVGDRGILGAGGAGFPTHRKLESMAGERVPMVIVNGAEGESASGKDGALLGHVPHLVLDGALAVARALGAPRVVVRIGADRLDLVAALESAFAERTDGIRLELSVGPATFVAGEASAVIRAVTGGPALPADLGRPPRTPRRLGRRREHVLVSNAETFARVAVAARGAQAASALASASGAVRSPGIVELPEEATLADLAARAGGLVGAPQVLITGGWHGRWVSWDQQVAHTALTRDAVAGVGGRWGAGAFVWVPGDLAPRDALVAVAQELAAGTAGQCGPCWRGLPAVAERLARMADAPGPGDPGGADDLARLLDQVDGRGICAHPSAAVAALRSALDLIGAGA